MLSKFFRVVSLLAILIGSITSPGRASPHWPAGWQEMEIEAKWEVPSSKDFDNLVETFRDGQNRYGYRLDVRWGGISRKFVDIYYDNAPRALSKSLHSIRHRTRYTSNPRASDNTLGVLEKATWNEDWQRVQYKSTPCRVDAVWFRLEAGDCYIADSRNRLDRLCTTDPSLTGLAVVTGQFKDHDALQTMLRDHPTYSFHSVQPLLAVVDYRYRVEFVNPDTEKPVYELSLDRVRTIDLRTGIFIQSFEAELEAVAERLDRSIVDRLLEIASQLESDSEKFSLQRSDKSKGGVKVGECSTRDVGKEKD